VRCSDFQRKLRAGTPNLSGRTAHLSHKEENHDPFHPPPPQGALNISRIRDRFTPVMQRALRAIPSVPRIVQ